MVSRDWIMVGIGFGIGFIVLTTIGRETVMTAAGMGRAEIKRVLTKMERKAKARAKL